MVVERLTPTEASERALIALGMDPTAIDLASPEALAALLRRAASFVCPTSARRLITTVAECVGPLADPDDEILPDLESLAGALLSHGDLQELTVAPSPGERQMRLLYLGPPTFVPRASGVCVLVGIRPEGVPLVGDDLAPRIEHDAHLRRLRFQDIGQARESLAVEGLREMTVEQWLRAPRSQTPRELIADYDARLDGAGPSGELEGVRLIDPEAPIDYYRGRWQPLGRRHSGRFVARRPQAFGADLWCYAEVGDGRTGRIVDLPVHDPTGRGCDEAWRLQAAIDAERGNAHRVRVTPASHTPNALVLDLFAPPPSWLQRRLDLFGTPLLRHSGALFSYLIAQEDLDDELMHLRETMWTDVQVASHGSED